jgi:hypothetical protein
VFYRDADSDTDYVQDYYFGKVHIYNIVDSGNHALPHNTQQTAFENGYGIFLQNAEYAVVEKCIVADNDLTGNTAGGYTGIEGTFADYLLFQKNYVGGNYTSHNIYTDGDAYDFDGGVQYSIMQFNYSEGNSGAGYLLSEGNTNNGQNIGNIVRFNISQDDGEQNWYGGISLTYGGSGTDHSINDGQIYNNTIYTSSPSRSGTGNKTMPFYIQDDALPEGSQGVLVYNNIFYVHVSDPTKTTDMLYFHPPVDPQHDPYTDFNMTFQHNDYYDDNPSGNIFSWITTSSGQGYQGYSSATSWASSAGQETDLGSNLYTMNPQLHNPGSGSLINSNINTMNTHDTTPGSIWQAYRLTSTNLVGGGLDLGNTQSQWHLAWAPTSGTWSGSGTFMSQYFSTTPTDFFGHTLDLSAGYNVGADDNGQP